MLAAIALMASQSGCVIIDYLTSPPMPGNSTNMTHAPEEAGVESGSETVGDFLASDRARMSRPSSLPFDSSWIKPGAELGKFSQIQLAPVTVAYLQPLSSQDAARVSPDEQRNQALDAALYVKEALHRAAGSRLQLVDSAGPGTLVLEVAIVQLTPAHAAETSGAISTAQSERAEQSLPASGGRIGFDWRLSDGSSGEELAAFSKTLGAPIPAAAPDRWAFVDPLTDRWARDAVSVLR
ncbi:MAG TPA: DUF3313 family protein [Candidatus Binataceae bacterium]|nr:DUF3313 family protein [Candidatus Binataceae bacterium]